MLSQLQLRRRRAVDGWEVRQSGCHDIPKSGMIASMTSEPLSPEESFDGLVAQFVDVPGVVPPGTSARFGRSALRFEGKIFAMLVRGELVVKLPRARVDELVDAGDGVRFDANKGTPMKEWLALASHSGQPWPGLAREALAFVAQKVT
jgi:hypothetical protein